MEELSLDTQAILLLCGRLDRARAKAVDPLTNGEYAAFATWLAGQHLRPADLVQIGGRSHLHDYDALDTQRLERLLDRGAQLAMQIEAWGRKGIWVVSRGDDAYPKRWKQRLGHAAPPLIHGVGAKTGLNRGGLAILGAKQADDDALAFAGELARRAADAGLDVIAGAGAGPETAAMEAAIQVEGTTVGVIAGNLERMMLEPRWRDGIVRGDLALCSVDGPKARAGAARAEARNALLYALADHAVVVTARAKKGSTWRGVIENAAAAGTPTLVFAGGGAGARVLADAGLPTIGIDALQADVDLAGWLAAHATPAAPLDGLEAAPSSPAPAAGQGALSFEAPEAEVPPDDLFDRVWPLLTGFLERPRTAAAVARQFGLRPAQAKDWLERAAKQGLAIRRGSPVRYRVPGA